MRTKRTLINSMYAILYYLLTTVLVLVVRKCFLQYLSTEFLGYEGLFGDIFGMLAIAELGIGATIHYRMYPAIAKNNEAEIGRLMAVYKFLYRIVGTFVFCAAIVLIPFLRIIIHDNTLNWSFVYKVYFIQLATTLCTYLLAYKRIMFTSSQQEAECTKVEMVCYICSNLIKIAVILLTHNYLLYLMTSMANNFVVNLIISWKINRRYPYLKNPPKVGWADVKELGVSKDVKNNFVQKLCLIIYGGTDNILITAFLGLNYVGMLNNYSIISGHVTQFFTKLLNPFQSSIGNLVYAGDKERQTDLFHMFDRLSFFLACFISTTFFVVYNPFITVWIGEKYLLSSWYVLAFAANQYVLYNHKFLTYYRGAFGKYELDKMFAFSAAVLNVTVSILLIKPLGMAGIMLGTVIGHMGFWVGRARVVYSEYMEESVVKYIVRQILNALLWLAELGVTVWLAGFLPMTWMGVVLRLMLCAVVPNLINLILFARTKSMALMVDYLKNIFGMILRRKK